MIINGSIGQKLTNEIAPSGGGGKIITSLKEANDSV